MASLRRFLRLLFFLAASSHFAWPAESAFRVGVILDAETLIGKVSRTCISMAVEDFYAAHPDSKTRIELSFRDGGGAAVGAASAALGLLKKEEVHAIMGPQRSAQSKFVMDLGNSAHVPVVSFSAKSPSLSPALSRYFVRAAMDDSSQAKAIAAIVQKFQWREVVPVFEDSDYGNGMAPFLVDELHAVGAAVPYRSMIPFNSSAAAVSAELEGLKQRRTRVFVVHASYELGSLIFEQAREAEMMGIEYVWMTTYSLTSVSTILGAAAGAAMEGVVGLKPFFRQTEKMVNFKQRWAERFREEHPESPLTEPMAFGLWGYDAVWALALAAEELNPANFTSFSSSAAAIGDFGGLGHSPVGSALLDAILNVDFEGLTGRFRLIDGQLDSSTSEIVNVVNGTLKQVGFWTAVGGVTRHLTKGPGLRSILWPGGQRDPPKGWEWPLAGQRLKIGVPVKPGFEQFVNVTWNPLTRCHEFSGFCIKIFHEVIRSLPYDVPFDFVAFDDGHSQHNGTYDDLIYQVFLKKFDGIAGDVTILANRSLYVDFSLPFTDSGVTLVVPVSNSQRKSEWVFTEPLSGYLWLATGFFVVFTGLVVWFLEHRVNEDFRGGPSSQAFTVFYFAFSTLVFTHREKVVSNWSRFVVVVWVFVVLILTSSYTASLTSMLTAQQLQPTVSNLGNLVKRNERVGYLNDSFMPGFLKQLRVDQGRISAYNSPDEYAAALEKGTVNGGVGGIVDEIPYLKVFLAKYCGKYAIVGPTYKTNGFGFAFPKGSPMLPDVSRAVLNFTEGKDFERLETALYGNKGCPSESFKMASGSLEFTNFRGLFIITGTASGGAVLIFIIIFFYNNLANMESILKSETSISGKFLLLLKLFDQSKDAAPETQETKGGEMGVSSSSNPWDGPSQVGSEMQSPMSMSIRPFDDEDSHNFLATPSPKGNETLGG